MFAITFASIGLLFLFCMLVTMRRVHLNISTAAVVLSAFCCWMQPFAEPIVGSKVIGPTPEIGLATVIAVIGLALAMLSHGLLKSKLGAAMR